MLDFGRSFRWIPDLCHDGVYKPGKSLSGFLILRPVLFCRGSIRAIRTAVKKPGNERQTGEVLVEDALRTFQQVHGSRGAGKG